MPAEIATGEYCASWCATYRVGSDTIANAFYEVTLAGAEGGAHCSCRAFQYGRGHNCKHIEAVYKTACLWNCQWHDGNQPVLLRPFEVDYERTYGGECPNCLGPLVPVRIAV